MEQFKIINYIQVGDKVTTAVPRPEYERLKEISDQYGISITQLLGQVVRYALKDGYEVEEVRV